MNKKNIIFYLFKEKKMGLNEFNLSIALHVACHAILLYTLL